MQHKSPAKRLFQGLVGLPPEPGDAAPAQPPAPVAVTEPVTSDKPKRGRPTKGDQPMSPAERQRQSRAGKRQVETAPEREQLIRRIVRRIKTSEHADPAMMKRAVSKFHEVLDALTVEDLRTIAKQYDVLHDNKGRSSLEGHTGTALIAGEFMDRLERIFSRSKTQIMYGGQKPAMGASPNVDDQSDEDSGESTSRAPMKVSEITVWDLIPLITEYLFEGDEEDMWSVEDSTLTNLLTLRCRACNQTVSTWVHARRHVEEMVKGGEKQLELIRTLEQAAEGSPGYEGMLVESRIRYRDVYWSHCTAARNFVTGVFFTHLFTSR